MAESQSHALVEPEVASEEDQRSRTRRQPPYNVIIHNDEEHSFEYVIRMLQQLFGYSLEKAFLLTHKAHTTGRAIVCTTSLERAELKRDQIRAFGADPLMANSKGPVRATIEAAGS